MKSSSYDRTRLPHRTRSVTAVDNLVLGDQYSTLRARKQIVAQVKVIIKMIWILKKIVKEYDSFLLLDRSVLRHLMTGE